MLDLNFIFENLEIPVKENEISVSEIEGCSYICKDKNHNVSFAILHTEQEIEKWPRDRKTPSLLFSSGKEITLRISGEDRPIDGRISIITCGDERLLTPFYAMVNAAVSDTSLIRIMGKDPIELWNFLEEFYECFSKAKRTTFSKRKAIGLWGELSKLREGEITEGILESWKGPENYVHDFISEDTAVDIKTTTRKNRIHNIKHDQLFDDSIPDMFIQSFMITKNHSSGKSIDEVIGEISEKLIPKLRLEFVRKLGLIGYNHHGEHAECSVKYSERSGSRLFAVETIPHISDEHIPDGIISMEYSITLDNLAPIPDHESQAIDRKLRGD